MQNWIKVSVYWTTHPQILTQTTLRSLFFWGFGGGVPRSIFNGIALTIVDRETLLPRMKITHAYSAIELV